ncbi:hypothetical protein HUN08_09030 [Gordonia sp. X0973]|uniref:LGFP repeat-containing protein n=1 Tax=Gordonia sp. X0973 TaxID=2742602 RepID=UPI000F533742|nr:hypothetical protein [Gordonia sp. X0973]QKT07313.1 hypothetical protein HUN08_09030 [Gordonia sp. X0973]
MRKLAKSTTAVIVGLSAVGLIASGCTKDDAKDAANAASNAVSSAVAGAESAAGQMTATAPSEVKVPGERGMEVTLSGPLAAKYASATEAQKKDLGMPLTGDHNGEKRESGVVFQQFQGGVIIAKNDDPGTPAYIVWGKIRDAWNVDRNAEGVPATDGKNGSAGPLGVATSDETTNGDMKESTFEHGKITYDTKTHKVAVTVNGKEVESGLK